MRASAVALFIASLPLACNGLVGDAEVPEAGDVTAPGDTPTEPVPIDVEPDGPSACDDIDTILATYNCTECHSATPGIGGGNLDLVTGDLGERLINEPSMRPSCSSDVLIDVETPEASLFLRVLDPERYADFGSESCEPTPMPFGPFEPLADADIDCVESWIKTLVADSETIDPIPFDPAPVAAATNKVKYLLHGGALTDEELLTATDTETGGLDPEALKGLIDSWTMNGEGAPTEEFRRKLLYFLTLVLDQRTLKGTPNFTYQSQLNLRNNPKLPEDEILSDDYEGRLVRSIPRAFLDEAMDIALGDRDFREIITSRRMHVNTAILVALASIDTDPLDRLGRPSGRLTTFEHLIDSDFNDWRYVTITQGTPNNPPDAVYEDTAEFAEAMRAVEEGDEVRFWAPRVGFFNTIVFHDTRETNPDNQFRIHVSQALIVALDLIFEASDSTEPGYLDALDAAHAAPETVCYGCHQHLDPMRPVFERYYNYRSLGLSGVADNARSSFAFHGHELRDMETMDDFGSAIATHPRLPRAWVQKLCMWANSQRCEESDPEFVRIVELFRDGYDAADPSDDFRFMTLVRELFSSTLITGAAPSPGHSTREFTVSVSRYHHFCEATRTRMNQGARLRCEQEGRPIRECESRHQPDCSGAGFKEAAALGSDAISRGQADLVTPSQEDPMFTVAAHQACQSLVRNATRNDGPYTRQTPVESIQRMVQTLMGLPPSHPRYAAARDAMLRTMTAPSPCPEGQDPLVANEGIAAGGSFRCGEGLSTESALNHVFEIACSSPDLVGLGF